MTTKTKTGESNTQSFAPMTRHQHWTQLVAHEDVQSYIDRGWEYSSGLVDTHHGERASLMVWPHAEEPPVFHK